MLHFNVERSHKLVELKLRMYIFCTSTNNRNKEKLKYIHLLRNENVKARLRKNAFVITFYLRLRANTTMQLFMLYLFIY